MTVLNIYDAFDCLKQLGFAISKSLYACGTATQEQFDYSAKIVNTLAYADDLYKAAPVDERRGEPFQKAMKEVREAIALIECKEGRAFMESLNVPTRVMVETLALTAHTYLPVKE